ncbi:MAG: amidohydrolase [Chloroflexi bacterium]|nr:amidohydrolase [Chloroflexota bacterium]
MIIDARCRPPTKEFQQTFKTSGILQRVPAFPVPDPPSFVNDSMELFFEEMKEAGIDIAVAVGRNRPRFEVSNDSIAELVNKYPDKIIGVAGIDVFNETHQALLEIERSIRQLKLRGVCIEPGGNRRDMNFDDPRLYPVYARCNELKVPVFLTTAHRQGTSIDHTNPVHIDHIARDFPQLKIVCAHACWPYVMEMIAVAQRYRNVFVSPDGYVFRPGGALYVEAIDRYLEEQFIFGSAYPLNPLKESVEGLKRFPLRKEVMNKIFYENAARLFGL